MGSEVHDDRAGAVLAGTSGSVGAERSLASGVLSSTRTEGRYVWLVETEAGDGADAQSKASRGVHRATRTKRQASSFTPAIVFPYANIFAQGSIVATRRERHIKRGLLDL